MGSDQLDVKDKDPFANADAEHKDNITTLGFVIRTVFRSAKVPSILYVIFLLIWTGFTELSKYFGN